MFPYLYINPRFFIFLCSINKFKCKIVSIAIFSIYFLHYLRGCYIDLDSYISVVVVNSFLKKINPFLLFNTEFGFKRDRFVR